MHKLYKITNKIFCLKFEHPYDLAMHFLRAQEFYESGSSQFKGQSFTIIDFMEYYAKNLGKGVFTYPDDWAGFNIDSKILKATYKTVIDFNKYDKEICFIYNKIKSICKTGKFQLLGVLDFDKTFDHELAHSLYATNSKYKKEISVLISEVPLLVKEHFYSYLKNIEYAKEVFEDELQAYFCNYLPLNWESKSDFKLSSKEKKQISNLNIRFKTLYSKYRLNIGNKFEEIVI